MSGGGGVFGTPRVPAGSISRQTLFGRLTAWPDLTVVHGPVGSGKTTLLAAWAATGPSPMLWWTADDDQLPFAEIERFAAAGAGTFVIDRGERVAADEFERLGEVIDRVPGLRVAVATRSARTIGEIAASSAVSLDIIGPEELRITLAELRDANRLGNDSERRAMLRDTDGLAVAVRVELETDRAGASGARERLRRTLLAECDGHPTHYEAALRIALLPRLDQAILEDWGISQEAVTGLNDAGIADWEDDWLQMSPYVRNVIIEESEQQMPLEQRNLLLTRAIHLSLIRRDPVVALDTAFRLDDIALASEVAITNMIDLLERRDPAHELFMGIPASKFRGYPILVMMFGVLSFLRPATRVRGRQILSRESLFQRLQPERGLHRDRVIFRVFEASILRHTPNWQGTNLAIERSVRELADLPAEDMESLGRSGGFLHVQLGLGAFYLQDFDLARRCFAVADAMHLEAGRADRVDPLSLQGGLAALCGDLASARKFLADADSFEWPTGWRERSPADFFHLGMAVLALEDGDLARTDLSIASTGPIVDIAEHWALYALVQARRDRFAGEVEAGLVRVQRLREQRGAELGSSLEVSFLDAAEAELHLAAGNVEAARRIAARSAGHGSLCRVVLARAELADDRLSDATLHARQILSSAPVLTSRSRLEANLVLACCALRVGHRRDAERVARRIVELLRSTGLKGPVRTVALRDRDALVEVLRHAGIEESLLGLFALEDLSVTAAADRIPPLTPREYAVLGALTATGSMEEIAVQLFVSRNTVKSQVRTLYRKLGVQSREAALMRAMSLGLLS